MRRSAIGIATAFAAVLAVSACGKKDSTADSANGGLGATTTVLPAPATATDSAAMTTTPPTTGTMGTTTVDSTRIADSVKAAAKKKP